MEIINAIKKRLSNVEIERDQLKKLLDVYGSPPTNGSITTDKFISKTDKCRHLLKVMMQKEKSWHINEIEAEFARHGVEFDKAMVHHALSEMRKAKKVIAMKVNKSNQQYYYANYDAKSGSTIKEEYLPMEPKFIETLELKH